jgi:dihydropteroate synthase
VLSRLLCPAVPGHRMLLARPIALDRATDLDAVLTRLGLPTPAREYLLDKLPHAQLLLTGLGLPDGRFLKETCEVGPAAALLPRYIPGNQEVRRGTALLSGARDQLERLVDSARAAPELHPLVTALENALSIDTPPEPTVLAGRRFAWGERTHIMGVLNVTPDSFSDGGRFASTERAVAQGLALAEAGADLLDIGGESTRPGAAGVAADDELARVLPVIEQLRARTAVPLSIDTAKSAVARAALAAGAILVNDVTGFSDPGLPPVTAAAGAAVCLMHMQGTPRTMQTDPRYDDVVAEVLEALAAAVARAEAAGIPRSRIWVDPGIGFGKTAGHNLFLLRHLRELRLLGCPVLVGPSRKSFLGALSGGLPPDQRLPGTLGSVAAAAVLGGADVVRVHDVAETRQALAVADAIGRAAEGGTLWTATRRR